MASAEKTTSRLVPQGSNITITTVQTSQPQRQRFLVENVSSRPRSLKDKRRQINNISGPVPQEQNVCSPTTEKTIRHINVGNFSSVLNRINKTLQHTVKLRKTTMIKHRMHRFKKMNLSILFVLGYKKLHTSLSQSFSWTGKQAFLNGPLKRLVYVAPRSSRPGMMNIDELSNFLMSKGFTKGTIDPTLFKIKYGEDILLVQIYVDDIIFGSTNPKYSKRFEKLMHSRFEMSLMGEMKFFLGLQIHQSPKGIFINQAKYALEILKKHNMDNCHSIGTPLATKPKLDVDLSGEPVDQSDYRSKIGSLMYLTSSRPDLVQAVCYCARYQARPTQKHLKEVKRIFKYLKGTINMGLWYPKDSGFELTAFSDADHAGCLDTRKSTSGGIQFLGDKLVSWMSKKQNCTAMSSAEAEYVALSASCAQVMWMRTQLQDYGFNYNKIPLYCDSQSAIAITCNPVQHSKTKHIHTRYHFIKEQVENGIIELYFVRTEYQLADMFTKALPEDRFKYLVRRIGMRCLTPAELEVLTNKSA
ncbi:retrovirus-related pol polyprotein from transposon TNT 1-94 [Tanacetum coccineum]|uniref:Retrovirus-related pol polyprotein from transposon TNT 1-94 n=1 Tax=Tanacetum coccineum TaxID=301880 RepID=A0ABQ5GKQ0_9ASTR